MHHIRACKIIALATLGLQLLALMVSCTLYYAENKPYYERLIADYESASQVSCHFPVWPVSHQCMAHYLHPSLLDATMILPFTVSWMPAAYKSHLRWWHSARSWHGARHVLLSYHR